MFIKLLDKNLSNMIAAGEVVERPASAVKEMCENSIDAGAGVVTVEITGGGLKMIKVTDNGCGIHPEDVTAAFMRHATSKISKAEDLDAIYTLGFRGEALASIAAVAEVELYTRTAEFDVGMTATANFGEIENAVETPGFVGTSITVSNLFYNTPARLKFLRKETTEAGYVEEVVRKSALAHPEVSFRLIVDGKEKLFTPGDGILKNAVFTIYGRDTSSRLNEISGGDDAVKVSGLVSDITGARKTRSMQMFFVNNRPVVSSMMSAAVEEACKGMITVGMHPMAIVKIDLPPQAIDINVHPSKLEVKFSDESRIYRAVYWAVKNSFGVPQMPKVDVEEESVREVKPVVAENKPLESAVLKQEPVQYTPQQQIKFTPVYKKVERPVITHEEQVKIESKELVNYRIIGQIFDTYIILQQGEDMLLVDQHAAHEHINFYKLKNQYENGSINIQQLITPVPVSLSPTMKAYATDNLQELLKLGFECDDFGDMIMVRGVPETIDIEKIGEALDELIDTMMGHKTDLTSAEKEKMIATISCRTSIKAGKKLSVMEMESLVAQLFEIERTVNCPHGRPAFTAISKRFFEKQFFRVK